jgi:hypothetical protein
MEEHLLPLAKRITQTQDKVEENSKAILDEKISLEESDEEKLIYPAANDSLNLSVCAVDGGLLADRLFGADILIRRSIAVNFVYADSALKDAQYLPKKFAEPEIEYKIGLDEHESLLWRSLYRLSGEIRIAQDALERFKPDYLLLDGSIVLLGSDKPGEQSVLYDEYRNLLDDYKKLYQKCESARCQLVGVIKDSRGKRLAQCLADKLIVDVPDTTLADSLLSEGERTCVVSYCSRTEKHPVLGSLGDFAHRFRLFYIKPSDQDLPLRIEFLNSGKGIDGISSLVNTLCGISKSFAYPAALIEADMCAALEPIEMDKVKRSLSVLTGGIVKPLRRAVRPFR